MGVIRVGTFNTYNLALPGFDIYQRGTAYSEEEFQDKTDWIARQLDAMEADVVGFQEVFHSPALQAALTKSRRFAGVTPQVLGTQERQEPSRTPAVALASRFDVLDVDSIRAIPAEAQLSVPVAGLDGEPDSGIVRLPHREFSRPVLKAKVRLANAVVATLFVAHLKSKRPTYLETESAADPLHRALAAIRSLIRRGAEAAGLRALVLSEVRGNRNPVIILGDVNDGTLSVTTQTLAGQPPFFRLSRERKQPYWDVLLYTAQQLQARASTRDIYYTHIYNGSYEALDHILVSEEFYARNPDRVGQVDYVRLLNDHLIDESQSFDRLPRTRSDHGQVVAKIRLL